MCRQHTASYLYAIPEFRSCDWPLYHHPDSQATKPLVYSTMDEATHAKPSDLEEDPLLYWKKSAVQHDFDPDTHIVEPQLHYKRLEKLEESVVTASEFFRCRGKYNLADNTLPRSGRAPVHLALKRSPFP
jgi:hypothetical protein